MEKLINENEIVEKAKRDSESFGKLFDFYYEKILKFCTYKTYNVALAHDIASETFFKALKNIRKYKNQKNGSFSAWLYKIALNEIKMYYRKNKRLVDAEDEKLEYLQNFVKKDDGLKKMQEKIDKEMQFEQVYKYIEKLSPDEQNLIHLRFFDDKSFKEIGEILGKKETAVRVKSHRALNKLREIIECVEERVVKKDKSLVLKTSEV